MSFPTREVRLIGVNGDAGLVVTALSSKSLGSRSFKPRDTGANPVRAASFRRRLFTRGRLRTTHRVSFRLADAKHEVDSAACRTISARMVQEQHAASPGLRSGCNSPCAHHFSQAPVPVAANGRAF